MTLNFVIANSMKTGSTLVTRLVVQHPDIECMHESYLPRFLDGSNILLDPKKFAAHGFDESTRLGLCEMYRESPNPCTGYKRTAEALLGDISKRTGATVLGDSYPFYAHDIDTALGAFPDVKVIYGVRDPRAVWWSAAKHIDPVTGKPRGNQAGDHAVHALLMADARMRQMKAQDPDRIFVFKYEDLVTDTRTVMDGIWTFLGVDPSQGYINYSRRKDALPGRWEWVPNATRSIESSRVNAWQDKIESVDAHRIVATTIGMMEHHGYDPKLSGALIAGHLLIAFINGRSLDSFDDEELGRIRAEVARMHKVVNMSLTGGTIYMQELEKQASAELTALTDKQWLQNYRQGYGNGLAHALQTFENFHSLLQGAVLR